MAHRVATIDDDFKLHTQITVPPSRVISVKPSGGDDTVALQAALTAASVGDTIALRGTYIVSSTLTLATSGVLIELAKNANIVSSIAASDTLRITAADVTISGGKITSPATFDGVNTQPTYAVIRATSTAPGLRVEGVTLVNVPKVGIYADDTDDLIVTDCKVIGNYPPASWTGTQTGHFGIAVNPSANGVSGRTIISDNIIRSCVQGVYIGNYGAVSTGAYGAVVKGNVFDGCHNHGIYNAGGVDACSVSGNTFTRCSLPVALTGAGHVVADNTMFTHGAGNNLDLIGISMRDPIGCSVTGNTLRGDAGVGQVVIDLANFSTAVEVSRNVVSNNTIEMTAGTSSAIRLGRSTVTEILNDNIVSNNTISGTASAGLGLITVAPKAGAAARGNKITGNTLVAKGECHGIYVGVSQHTTVQDNSIRFEYNAPSAKAAGCVVLAGASRAVVGGNDYINAPGFGTNLSLRGAWELSGTTDCSYHQDRHDAGAGLTSYAPYVPASGSNAFLDVIYTGVPGIFGAPGSRWSRLDGGAATSLYIKETVSTSATWRAL